MRPLRLELQAFGSFPGREEIDFEALARRGLFVVTGPTGSGKTTLFDAMVYALYGVLPGSRASDGEPRSHHADARAETYVQLDFEVQGVRHRVQRKPKQERPRQRGTGMAVMQLPEALLVRMDGGLTESLATQANRCTQACERLVGLDAKQFQRVVLLPQGKFTDFLLAKDEQREELLRQLFGGEVFEAATAWLKRKASALEEEVREVEIEIGRQRANAVDAFERASLSWSGAFDRARWDSADAAAVRAGIDVLQPVRDRRRGEVASLHEMATKAAEEKARAERDARQFDDAASSFARFGELEAQREDVARSMERLAASRRARPVLLRNADAEHKGASGATARRALSEVYVRVERGCAALGRSVPEREPGPVTAALAEAHQHCDEQRASIEHARRAAAAAQEAREQHDAAIANHDRVEAELAQLREAIDTAKQRLAELDPVAATGPERRVAVDAAQKRLGDRLALVDAEERCLTARAAAQDAEDAYTEVMARFVATQAPRLAERLVAGEPCPVCGSNEHPAPATLLGAAPAEHDDVNAAQAVFAGARADVRQHATTCEALRGALGMLADAPVLALDEECAAAKRALAEAEAAAQEGSAVQRRLGEHERGFAAASDREREAVAQAAGLAARAEDLQKSAERARRVAEGIDVAALDRNAALVKQLIDATRELAALHRRDTAAETERCSAEAALEEALAVSGYDSVEVAAAHLLPEPEESEIEAREQRWRTASAETSQRLRMLEEQGVPAERPDVDAVVTRAREAAEAANAAASAFTTGDDALRGATASLEEAARIARDSSDLRTRCDTARIVFRTCNGEAGTRIKLERWVLAAELDRVTAAANEHLARMTAHRYRLARNAGSRGGLGLEVFDAHTGRARPTASLSGGEQFQASLALALGLADVVSRGGTASGRQFEALFVDEGFGSLDPDALDDAIAALAQLRATGRTVGAITHVEAMKQQLHVGIDVRRLAHGRGSTVQVNP